MKYLTTKTTAIMLVLAVGVASAQVDNARMERDLEIAENILGTLSSSDGERSNRYFFGHNAKSSYVEGYGVIFNLPSSNNIYYVSSGGNSERVVIGEGGSGGYTYSYSAPRDSKDRSEDIAAANVLRKARELDLDSLQKVKTQRTVEIMKTFLADYADLIGQLKPTDHIMITTRSTLAGNDFNFGRFRKTEPGTTAEVIKSDLTAYKAGKISRDQLIGKITITEDEASTEKVADLELLASIFERLYEADLSNTYYCSGAGVRYEKLKNFGAIVSMKVYSSNSDGGLYTLTTQGLSNLSKEERDAKVQAMYPEFEKTLKENIINYGRTVKSLQPSEMLMFKVRLTECKSCDMPKAIDVSVEASVLMDFDKGKLSLDAAVAKIKVKKYEQ